MREPLDKHQIKAAFLTACRAELDALKPGNVHRHASGHGMEVAHFERAAEAAAGPIADASLSVGQRILRATEASVAATGLNTNLGIVLLAAPLAKAASETTVEMRPSPQARANSVGTRRARCAKTPSLQSASPTPPVSATSTRVTYALILSA